MSSVETARTLSTCVVIDDHPLMLSTTSSVLEGAGYAIVGTASSGDAALELVPALAPDFAVIDFELPDLTGVELGAKLRKLLPDTELILHSARIDPITVAAALGTGIRGLVVKGNADRLLEAVAAVQEGRVYLDPTLASRPRDASPPPPPDDR